MAATDPIVLGIDPGTLVTGYGVISQSGSRLIHIANGSIKPPSGETLPRRLDFICEGLQKVMRDHRPTTVAVESIFYSKNVKSAITLAHARGIALLVAAQNHVPVSEYSPMEVKRSTVGYGKATKDQIQNMVSRLFNLGKADASALKDSFDALAVALCHLNVASTQRRIHPTLSATRTL